jgi:RHS repeat-associated protein
VRVGGVLDATKNNGNLESQVITAPKTGGGTLTLTQSYLYDQLNRLSTATEVSPTEGTTWSQTYGYDQYGNRALTAGYIVPGNEGLTPRTVGSPTSDINPATNRISQCLYDKSGNVLNDQIGRSFSYDSENRQLTFNGTAGQYRYDCAGRRVSKTDSGGTTVFVYSAVGKLIAEYMTGTPPAGGTSYLTSDHLGSTRVVTDGNGAVKSRRDYLPYGEEIPGSVGRGSVTNYGVSDGVRQKFTQKERDSESGLDYFLARYYSSAQGRFTSPDEFKGGPEEFWASGKEDSAKRALPYADLAIPQSLNKYQYCYGNPLTFVDPDGHHPAGYAIAALLAILGGADVANAPGINSPTYPSTGPGEVMKLVALDAGFGIATKVLFKIASPVFSKLIANEPTGFVSKSLTGAESFVAAMAQARAFEQRVLGIIGVQKNTLRIMKGEAKGAAYRIPDAMYGSMTGKIENVLAEIKSGRMIDLTPQLKDFIRFVSNKETPWTFNLYVRPDAVLSSQLIQQLKSVGANVYDVVGNNLVKRELR